MLGWYLRRSRAALLRLSGFFTKVLWLTSANIHAKNRLMGSIPALVWTGDTALIYDTDYRIFIVLRISSFHNVSFLVDGKATLLR